MIFFYKYCYCAFSHPSIKFLFLYVSDYACYQSQEASFFMQLQHTLPWFLTLSHQLLIAVFFLVLISVIDCCLDSTLVTGSVERGEAQSLAHQELIPILYIAERLKDLILPHFCSCYPYYLIEGKLLKPGAVCCVQCYSPVEKLHTDTAISKS